MQRCHSPQQSAFLVPAAVCRRPLNPLLLLHCLPVSDPLRTHPRLKLPLLKMGVGGEGAADSGARPPPRARQRRVPMEGCARQSGRGGGGLMLNGIIAQTTAGSKQQQMMPPPLRCAISDVTDQVYHSVYTRHAYTDWYVLCISVSGYLPG